MIQDTKILLTFPKESLIFALPKFSNAMSCNTYVVSSSMFLNLPYLKPSKMVHTSGKIGQISIKLLAKCLKEITIQQQKSQ